MSEEGQVQFELRRLTKGTGRTVKYVHMEDRSICGVKLVIVSGIFSYLSSGRIYSRPRSLCCCSRNFTFL